MIKLYFKNLFCHTPWNDGMANSDPFSRCLHLVNIYCLTYLPLVYTQRADEGLILH